MRMHRALDEALVSSVGQRHTSPSDGRRLGEIACGAVTSDVLWLVALLGAFTLSVSAMAGVLGAMVDNVWSIKPQRLGLAELAARREASITWLALPGLAYLLSIVTNLGTSLIDQNGYAGRTAWLVLAGGFLFLEIVAIAVMSQSGRRRNEWQHLTDWVLLHTEIDRRRKERGASPEWWLTDAREQAARIDATTTRLGDLRGQAFALLNEPRLSWRTRPALGLFRYVEQGRTIRVPVRVVSRWFLVSRWSWFFVVVSVVTVVSWCWLGLQSSTQPLRSAAWLAVWVVPTVGLAYLKTRAALIYYARVHALKRETRDRCLAALDELQERGVPRSPGPLGRFAGRLWERLLVPANPGDDGKRPGSNSWLR